LPVTVIEAGPCPVIAVLEGRVELGFGAKKPKNAPKALAGHAKKGGVETTPRVIRRFDVTGEAPPAGSAVTVAIFETPLTFTRSPSAKMATVTAAAGGRRFAGHVKAPDHARRSSRRRPSSRGPRALWERSWVSSRRSRAPRAPRVRR